MNKSEVVAIYNRVLAHAKIHTDKHGCGNDNPELCAFNGVRSEVYAVLAKSNPLPGPHADDDGDPDMLFARQKSHGKKLWKQADAIVASAGITEKGTN